ncbi:hypothetical protein RclHR1_00810017 [Rhizophagus clarus]|uniref:DUF7431 domain-containing protein n=1 Tax=Rhizophagus clarus TaxID=94130 RepID=A0A2Z6SB23_9GLOM|nr:hypothetical protein RclHR1_00810017 [Rhizophagus clarus]GES95285.1 hypothetical protein GLOIN_2v1487729 [Rhizophagus clarus]
MLTVYNYFFSNTSNNSLTDLEDVTVQVNDPSLNKFVHLNLDEKLSKVRKRLEDKSIDMGILSFAIKNDKVIAREEEGERILKEIVGRDKILYLKKDSEPDRKYLCNKNKLEFGRINGEFKEANERAFIIEDCKMINVDNKYQYNVKEINTNEDFKNMKISCFTAEANAHEFAKFGITAENFRANECNYVTNSTCKISEYSKVTLKLNKLKPTKSFIEAVKDVIKSEDPRNLKGITERFGKFIPTEITLGGRILIKKSNASREYMENNSNEAAASAGVRDTDITARKKFIKMWNKKNTFNNEGFELIGGDQFGYEDFDETEWSRTLEDFRKWGCIKFGEPISIFERLPVNLRREVLELTGKIIHYSTVEDIPTYKLREYGMSNEFELKIPDFISETYYNKEADCSVFATVIDTERTKKDCFCCQILCPSIGNPKLLIHCIQKRQRFRNRECNLRVRWMIIGYVTNFNFNQLDFNIQLKVQSDKFISSNCRKQYVKYLLDFEYRKNFHCIGIPIIKDPPKDSFVIGHHFFNDQENRKIGSYIFSYCFEKRHYVNLPDFTFNTLVILSHPKSRMLHFKDRNKKILFIKPKPKYISLCTNREDNCGPIFMKQKANIIKKIDIEVDDNCEIGDNCICKNKTLKELEKDLKFICFAPKNTN